jgi:hypothetical protein
MRPMTRVVAVHSHTEDMKMLSLDSMSCCPTLLGLSSLPMAVIDSDLPSLPTDRTSGLPRDLHRP